MKRKPRRLFTALVTVPVGALLIFLPSRDVFSQVPPGYQELFRDPPRTDELTPADLPNLGRQVVLEAISMYSHALSEIRNSPYSNRLYAAHHHALERGQRLHRGPLVLPARNRGNPGCPPHVSGA